MERTLVNCFLEKEQSLISISKSYPFTIIYFAQVTSTDEMERANARRYLHEAWQFISYAEWAINYCGTYFVYIYLN